MEWLYTFLIFGRRKRRTPSRASLNQVHPFLASRQWRTASVLVGFHVDLVNRKQLMGKYTNSRLANVIAWERASLLLC